jgi:hypothetical protein
MTASRSLAAALPYLTAPPDLHRFRSLDPIFFLTISLAFFLFSAILSLRKYCGSAARQTSCRFFILWRSLRRFPKFFRMNTYDVPRFALFCRQFWTRNPFRMNTYKKSSEVFILNNLELALSFLESTLTGKGGGGEVLDILAFPPSDITMLSP